MTDCKNASLADRRSSIRNEKSGVTDTQHHSNEEARAPESSARRRDAPTRAGLGASLAVGTGSGADRTWRSPDPWQTESSAATDRLGLGATRVTVIPTPLLGLEFAPRLETLRHVPDQKDLRRHVQSRIESPWTPGKEISCESIRDSGMANSLDPHSSPSIC